jgi:FAD-dependent urate hydroxylase
MNLDLPAPLPSEAAAGMPEGRTDRRSDGSPCELPQGPPAAVPAAVPAADPPGPPAGQPGGTPTARGGVIGLAALEARLRQDLAWLDLPAKPWVPPMSRDGRPVLSVAIVGGGQAGLAASAALKHLGIAAPVFDQSPQGFEGPWATTARMETLRSPKQLAGPALGLPALTFRAWFESQFGLAEWEAMDKIPRLQWMEYLRWYRRVMEVDVRNLHRVEAVVPRADGLVELAVVSPTGREQVLARRVILATGFDGLGGPYLPSFAYRLPAERRLHSSDPYDYSTLAGKRVGIIGGGSAAMDSAATALECGAARVDLLVRRNDLPRINKSKGAGNAGLMHGHVDLPDEWKWRIRHYINVQQGPPPRGSTQRVSRHKNVRFFFGCGVLDLGMAADPATGAEVVKVQTPKGTFTFDFVIFATGLSVDWNVRPEFAAFAPHVRTWGDRFRPGPDQEDSELAAAPDVGPIFEFIEKTPGACPGLSRIHCLGNAAVVSHGGVAGDIPGISLKAQRVAQGIASLLYREDVEIHYANIESHADPELLGDEWVPSNDLPE